MNDILGSGGEYRCPFDGSKKLASSYTYPALADQPFRLLISLPRESRLIT